MISKTLRADFFQPTVEVPKGGVAASFTELLMRAWSGREPMQHGGVPVWIHDFTDADDSYVGFMVRHQSNEPAIKGSVVDGTLSRVPLDAGEALSGICAFLYNPECNLLCLQRNRNAVGPSTLAKYIRRCSGMDRGAIDMRVVIRPEALRRIREMKQFRKLEVKVATFEDMRALRRQVPDVAGGIEMAKMFDAPVFQFTLSMGREGGSLSRRKTIEAVRELLQKFNQDPDAVSMLRVYGKDDADDDLNAVDLIENRVVYEENVRLSDEPNELFPILYGFIRRAWDEHRDELRELSRSAL